MLPNSVQSLTIAGYPALVTAESKGSRPDIVLIHGAFSHGEHFRSWVEYLGARGYAVVAPTLRRPDASLNGLRFGGYLKAARDILSALCQGAPPPAVLGHSMGGLLVQKLVESGDCRAAVLVASAPPAMLTAQPRSLPYLLPMFPRILAGLPVKPPATALRALVLHKLAEVDRRAFTRSFVTESGLVYREMIFGRIRVAVGGRTCPVLCIAGTDDRIVSLRLARATARRWCAPLREYPGRGHWLLAEPRWEEVAGEVVAWLKSQDILPGEQRPAR